MSSLTQKFGKVTPRLFKNSEKPERGRGTYNQLSWCRVRANIWACHSRLSRHVLVFQCRGCAWLSTDQPKRVQSSQQHLGNTVFLLLLLLLTGHCTPAPTRQLFGEFSQDTEFRVWRILRDLFCVCLVETYYYHHSSLIRKYYSCRRFCRRIFRQRACREQLSWRQVWPLNGVF